MQVDFYHLVVSPLDRVLPQIAEKVLASGGRLLIIAQDAAMRVRVDRLLWTFSADSFVPHAQAGEGEDASQPILIASDPVAGNGARTIALVDGTWRDEALCYDRALHFFDADSVEQARGAWKGLAPRDDIERRYWKQDDRGRFVQAA